jgi:PAT family beta-lactamase induction signal transducer AmpG
MKEFSRGYFTAPLITILFLGFSSGLPLALTGATLAAWLAQSKVDIGTIGLFAAVATPYTLKFLWSPFMDALPFPVLSRLLGRRRGWILATQGGLLLALGMLALARPDINPFITAMIAILVAFLSASQDIVIDAYRVEILTPEEQGKGAAMTQLGYRLGMIASSAGAFYIASYAGWQFTYFAMGGLMGVGIVAVLLAKEPLLLEADNTALVVPSLRESVINPFTDFMSRQSWALILVFVILYKLADAFIGIVTNPFLISIGFDLKQIANIVKIYGVIATLLGTFTGGWLVSRYGAIRILFIAGFLHAVTNLLYAVQAHVGADAHLLAVSIAVENISGGVSSAAFVAYLSNLTNRHYTATQYALLSSLAAMARTWLATPSGFVAKQLGWQSFFLLATLLALPGLLVLCWLQKRVKQ